MERGSHSYNKALDVTVSFNKFVSNCKVTPIEYLVQNSLFVCCVEFSGSKDVLITASVTDIAQKINLHREQVRRTLIKLREKGLAKSSNGQWLFAENCFR